MKRKNIYFARQLRKGQTEVERLLWFSIRGRQLQGYKFRRQYTIGEFIVDFICLEGNLIVELDGGDHSKETHRLYDMRRTRYLENKGYKVVRFWNNEVLNNLDGVLEILLFNLKNPHSSLLPKGEGE